MSKPKPSLKTLLSSFFRSSCNNLSPTHQPTFLPNPSKPKPKPKPNKTKPRRPVFSGHMCPPSTPNKIKTKPKLFPDPYGFTSSSEDEKVTIFGSEEEETQTLFSSRSFSSDSSGFYSTARKKGRRRSKSFRNGFRPLVTVQERKATVLNRKDDGFVVVKASRDPYKDFRGSVLEMVMEKQIFGREGLRKLMVCYLELNDVRNHLVIRKVFADVSEVLLFGN